MTLVLAVFALRFFLYSLITNPWWSLPIECLNGVTFGVFYTTMTSYANIIAPVGFGATMQGVVGAAFEGAGVAVGSLVGGAIYKTWGGMTMFRVFGVFSLIMCVLHAIIQLLLKGRKVPKVLESGGEFYVTAAFDIDGEQSEGERPIVRTEAEAALLQE